MEGNLLSSVLRFDAKQATYKIALLRAINDVALAFPGLPHGRPVAVPVRLLASYWIAYYWPFVDLVAPVMQGHRAMRRGGLTNDVSFRPQLTRLRAEWETLLGGRAKPSDGFFLVGELRVPRKRRAYPDSLLRAYRSAVTAVTGALDMPIRHAGTGRWELFRKPVPRQQLLPDITCVPGTEDSDRCLVIPAELWRTFQEFSLWVEALCIHEWCLFTERVTGEVAGAAGAAVGRGDVYSMLTDRPDNRRPLTWERNRVDIMLMEGLEFVCPWTERRIRRPEEYSVDHLIPLALYPINELWNLVPADPRFNSHVKRDRAPSPERLDRAEPHITLAYANYMRSADTREALTQDVALRFASLPRAHDLLPGAVARAAVDFVDRLASARHAARF